MISKQNCNLHVGSTATQKHHYQEVMKQLSMNKAIDTMKQDKGYGVVIMNWSELFEKRLSELQMKQFTKLDYNPTRTLENKVKRTFRKMKSKTPGKYHI